MAGEPPYIIRNNREYSVMSSGGRLDLSSLFNAITSTIRPTRPFRLVNDFRNFNRTLELLRLLSNRYGLFLNLLIRLNGMTTRFAKRRRLIMPSKVLLLRVFLVWTAPPPNKMLYQNYCNRIQRVIIISGNVIRAINVIVSILFRFIRTSSPFVSSNISGSNSG